MVRAPNRSVARVEMNARLVVVSHRVPPASSLSCRSCQAWKLASAFGIVSATPTVGDARLLREVLDRVGLRVGHLAVVQQHLDPMIGDGGVESGGVTGRRIVAVFDGLREPSRAAENKSGGRNQVARHSLGVGDLWCLHTRP